MKQPMPLGIWLCKTSSRYFSLGYIKLFGNIHVQYHDQLAALSRWHLAFPSSAARPAAAHVSAHCWWVALFCSPRVCPGHSVLGTPAAFQWAARRASTAFTLAVASRGPRAIALPIGVAQARVAPPVISSGAFT